MSTLKLYVNDNGILEVERGMNNIYEQVAKNIAPEQALSLAKIYTRNYEEVFVYDDEYEAYIMVKNRMDKPKIYSFYDGDKKEMEKKYGLYVAPKYDESDQTDLDKEKWDNYWGDYNQCGIRIDY